MAKRTLAGLLPPEPVTENATRPQLAAVAPTADPTADQPSVAIVAVAEFADPVPNALAENSERPRRPRNSERPSAAPAMVGPRYLQMERKEARLRLDQAEALATLTRRLNRARAGAGERITDNTLLRIAVDLLLEHQDALLGATEDTLRASVTNRVRN